MSEHGKDNFDCDAMAAELRRMAAACSAEPSAGLTTRIITAVEAEKVREHARRRAAAMIAAACAAAACVVAAFVPAIWHDSASPAQVSVAASESRAERDAADMLAAMQESDGSWSPSRTGGSEEYRPALTALAAMALLRHAPERHAKAISRAEAALVAMQNEDGSFGANRTAAIYNHSFATFALLDLAISRGESINDTLSSALSFSLSSQEASGAWAAQRGSDAPLTLWQTATLAKAQKAGWEDDGGHLRRGLAWLRREGLSGPLDYRESFADKYTPRLGNIALTAMAAAELEDEAHMFPALRETAANATASIHLAMDQANGPAPVSGLYVALASMLSR